MTIHFPHGFDWGTATAAHQIEGGSWNNDWWAFEHREGTVCRESSGDACDSWNRWDDDVALVEALGLSSYRFSIEWSRIEPAPGEWSDAAIAHYRRLGERLHAAGVDQRRTRVLREQRRCIRRSAGPSLGRRSRRSTAPPSASSRASRRCVVLGAGASAAMVTIDRISAWMRAVSV